MLWIGAGLIVKQARRVEALAQALLSTSEPELPAASDAGPPAHWLEVARSPGPPQHWVERVRKGAPHLLAARGDAEGPGRRIAPAARSGAKRTRSARSEPAAATAVRQPSEEAGRDTAAESGMRMRIRVLDKDSSPGFLRPSQRKITTTAQAPGGTKGDATAAMAEDSGGNESVARDEEGPAEPSRPRFLRPASRRSSTAHFSQPSDAESGGVEQPAPTLARRDSPATEKRQLSEPSARLSPREPEEVVSSWPEMQPPAQRGADPGRRSDRAVLAEPSNELSTNATAGVQRRQSRVASEEGESPASNEHSGARQPRWAQVRGETRTEARDRSAETEGHWPSLPSPEEDVSPSAETVLRIWKHRRRLDEEQQGTAWNA